MGARPGAVTRPGASAGFSVRSALDDCSSMAARGWAKRLSLSTMSSISTGVASALDCPVTRSIKVSVMSWPRERGSFAGFGLDRTVGHGGQSWCEPAVDELTVLAGQEDRLAGEQGGAELAGLTRSQSSERTRQLPGQDHREPDVALRRAHRHLAGQRDLRGNAAVLPLGRGTLLGLEGALGRGERCGLSRLRGDDRGFQALEMSDPFDTVMIVDCRSHRADRRHQPVEPRQCRGSVESRSAWASYSYCVRICQATRRAANDVNA